MCCCGIGAAAFASTAQRHRRNRERAQAAAQVQVEFIQPTNGGRYADPLLSVPRSVSLSVPRSIPLSSLQTAPLCSPLKSWYTWTHPLFVQSLLHSLYLCHTHACVHRPTCVCSPATPRYAQAQHGYMYPQAEAAPAYSGPGEVYVPDTCAYGAPPPAYDEVADPPRAENSTQGTSA